MLNKIEVDYVTISSLMGITFGILIIVFRKRFLKTMMEGVSKQNDVLSQVILETWENKSSKRASVTAIIVGLVFIVISLLQLIQQ
jgi:hypothetical protein